MKKISSSSCILHIQRVQRTPYFWMLVVAFAMPLQAFSTDLSGVIFEDSNRNGIQDKTEKGLRDIPVSNGDTVVLTDALGRYRLPLAGARSVFPILPARYALTDSSLLRNRLFGSIHFPNRMPQAWAVAKTRVPSNFKFAAVGDVQVGDLQETGYAAQSIFPELSARKDLDFCIYLGDLVNEKTQLFPVMASLMSATGIPSWTLMGNHDRVFTSDPLLQDSAFAAVFGPSDYAFNYGNIHFIVLNNNWSNGKRHYRGGYTERQLRFVRNNLRYVKKGTQLVIAQHIPFEYVKEKQALLDLLRDHKVFFISGHTHTVARIHTPEKGYQELIAGAVCGNWWIGERDVWGIPSAVMQCGSPRGYFDIAFSGDAYQLKYKIIGGDAEKQMDIWVAGQDTVEQHLPLLQEKSKQLVIANIYAASAATEVMIRIDGGEWTSMAREKTIAPAVMRNIAMNQLKIYPTTYSYRAALRKSDSPHCWTFLLPEDLAKGWHTCEIRAKEGTVFRAEKKQSFYR